MDEKYRIQSGEREREVKSHKKKRPENRVRETRDRELRGKQR